MLRDQQAVEVLKYLKQAKLFIYWGFLFVCFVGLVFVFLLDFWDQELMKSQKPTAKYVPQVVGDVSVGY